MKVLKNNYNNKQDIDVFPKKHICENCCSELEYEESDIEIGSFGCTLIYCPLCGHENPLDDYKLTVDNIEFPKHFYHFSKDVWAVDYCNEEEIKKIIKKAIDYFRTNKNDDCGYYYSAFGNLIVIVFKNDGDEEYDVITSGDYYDSAIPFEQIDYLKV